MGAGYGNTETVKALLEVEGIEVNHKNKDGNTALKLAVDSTEIADILRQAGATE